MSGWGGGFGTGALLLFALPLPRFHIPPPPLTGALRGGRGSAERWLSGLVYPALNASDGSTEEIVWLLLFLWQHAQNKDEIKALGCSSPIPAPACCPTLCPSCGHWHGLPYVTSVKEAGAGLGPCPATIKAAGASSASAALAGRTRSNPAPGVGHLSPDTSSPGPTWVSRARTTLRCFLALLGQWCCSLGRCLQP